MGDNLSDGAKIAAIFVTLIAVLTIVFSMIATIKHLAASQSQSLQNTLTKLASTEFVGYDQKTITGADVIAATKIFEGRNSAFVVVTRSDKSAAGNGSTTYEGHLYGAKLTAASALVSGNHGASNSGTYIVCKVNSVGSGEESSYPDGDSATEIAKYSGNSYYTAALYTNASGSTEFNMNIRPTEASGRRTYVRDSGKFFSELIKDKTGDTIGAVFTQLD